MRHKAYEQKIVDDSENEMRLWTCAMPWGAQMALVTYCVPRTSSDAVAVLFLLMFGRNVQWEVILAMPPGQVPITDVWPSQASALCSYVDLGSQLSAHRLHVTGDSDVCLGIQ